MRLKCLEMSKLLKTNAQPSAFAENVYQKLREVPVGWVTTYQDLAKAVTCRSAQAIGQVLRRNPYAPQVPCHRVVNSRGELHGFNGQQSLVELAHKQRLLEKEGLAIIDGKIVDFAQKRWKYR